MQISTGHGPKMRFSRLPQKDPRTIARDIPGIFDVIFPQLAPGVVSYFNKLSTCSAEIEAVPDEVVEASKLNRAMLFELAFARAEAMIEGGGNADWNTCLKVAVERQQRYFDAELPVELTNEDAAAAEWVATNLVKMIAELRSMAPSSELIVAPEVPGFQWIAKGNGDFAIGSKLLEVKCSNSRFGAADYRQILMYWLLSFAASIENEAEEWKSFSLLNPRTNFSVDISFDELISITAAGRSKIEILELFATMIGDIAEKSLPEYQR